MGFTPLRAKQALNCVCVVGCGRDSILGTERKEKAGVGGGREREREREGKREV